LFLRKKSKKSFDIQAPLNFIIYLVNKKGAIKLLDKIKRAVTVLLLVSLAMAVLPPAQPALAAEIYKAVDGRTLPLSLSGDTSEWIEIAQYQNDSGSYSLILRKNDVAKSAWIVAGNPRYDVSLARDKVNGWFTNNGTNDLHSDARLREFTVKSNAASIAMLGAEYSVGSVDWSKPSGGINKNGTDVAFLLNYSEAANFCSTQYATSPIAHDKSSETATANFNKLTHVIGDQPTNHWWLRSFGLGTGKACTVGLGGSNQLGQGGASMNGAVQKYDVSSNIIMIRPALWVDSGVFEADPTPTPTPLPTPTPTPTPTPPPPENGLTVSKTPNAYTVKAGSDVIYTISVSAAGAATAVVIAEYNSQPGGVWGAATRNGTPVSSGFTVLNSQIVIVDRMAAGDVFTIEYKLLAVTVGTISNKVQVASSEGGWGEAISPSVQVLPEGSEVSLEAAVKKVLDVPIGTSYPAMTFKFEALKVSVDGRTTEEAKGTMPDIGVNNKIHIDFSGAAASDPKESFLGTSAAISTYSLESEDIFKDVEWPHAGIYVYEIIEEYPSTSAGTNVKELLRLSAAKYRVTVYIANGVDSLYIDAISIQALTKDKDSQVVGNNGKVEQMTFTNGYVKTNVGTDPKNEKDWTLAVGKTVSGVYSNTTRYFNFSLTITDHSIANGAQGYGSYKAYIVEKGGNPQNPEGYTVVQDLSNNGLTKNGDDTFGPYVTFASGGEKTFKLKHNQLLVFLAAPVGTLYEVAESGTAYYIPGVDVKYNGGMVGSAGNTVGEGVALDKNGPYKDNLYVSENGSSAKFTNIRDSAPVTGLDLDNLPFIVAIVMILGALAVLAAAKFRKKRKMAA